MPICARTLFVAFCLAGSLAAVASEPQITEAILGLDRIDKPGGYEISKPATEFFPDSPRVVCVLKMEGASAGTTLNSVWIAEDVGAAESVEPE